AGKRSAAAPFGSRGRHRRDRHRNDVREKESMILFVTLLGMALVTYLLRSSFLLLPPGIETPALLKRALRYVPAGVLTAIWAPEVLLHGNEQLAAGAVALLTAWR